MAALALLSTAALPAQTVFTTFGPGDAHGTGGWSVAETVGTNFLFANSFTYSSATGKVLSLLRIAATAESTGPLKIEFLHGLSIGSAAVLESWSVNAGTPGVSVIFALSSVLSPALVSGDTYWVELLGAPDRTDVAWAWNYSTTTTAGLANSLNGGATWTNDPGLASGTFDVTVADVPSSTTPEPAALSMLAMGLVGVAGFARRRKR